MGDMWEAASELESIARHLRAAGEVELRQSLLKAVTEAVKPVGDDVRAGLPDHMPKRYAGVLDADLRISTSTRLSGDDPSVSLVGRPRGPRKRKLRRLNDTGILGHPVYGMRSRTNPRMWAAWSDQTSHVRAGFFTAPAEKAAPRVRDAILKALDDVAQRAVRKGP